MSPVAEKRDAGVDPGFSERGGGLSMHDHGKGYRRGKGVGEGRVWERRGCVPPPAQSKEARKLLPLMFVRKTSIAFCGILGFIAARNLLARPPWIRPWELAHLAKDM